MLALWTPVSEAFSKELKRNNPQSHTYTYKRIEINSFFRLFDFMANATHSHFQTEGIDKLITAINRAQLLMGKVFVTPISVLKAMRKIQEPAITEIDKVYVLL